MTGTAYGTTNKLNSRIVLKQIGKDLFQAFWRGTNNPVCRASDNMPVHCFPNRKGAIKYLLTMEII